MAVGTAVCVGRGVCEGMTVWVAVAGGWVGKAVAGVQLPMRMVISRSEVKYLFIRNILFPCFTV